MASKSIDYVAQCEESDGHCLTRVVGDHGGVVSVKGRNIVVTQRGEEGKTVSGAALTFTVQHNEVLRYRARFIGRSLFGAVIGRYRDDETQIERRVVVPVPGGAGGQQDVIRNKVFPSEREARAEAEGRARQLQQKAELILDVHGRPDIRAGGTVTVVGLRDGIDGTWKIARVEHILNQNGYQTRIEALTDSFDGNPGLGAIQ